MAFFLIGTVKVIAPSSRRPWFIPTRDRVHVCDMRVKKNIWLFFP